MQVIECQQRSELWEEVRRGIPTASQFKRLGYDRSRKGLGQGAWSYIYELIAQSKRVDMPSPPSFWMEWGTENEPDAVESYEELAGVNTTEVGFIINHGAGCSPDRLIGADGLLEVKCPAPQTHIGYLIDNCLPDEHAAQVYGQLWICERDWCDFVSWHPGLPLFCYRVTRGESFDAWLEKFDPLLRLFNEELKRCKEVIG